MPRIYDPQNEHDACGVGMVAQLDQISSHSIVADALTILENLEHRGASGADPESGDGAGILMQIPHEFVVKKFKEHGVDLPDSGLYGIGQWMLHPEANSSQKAAIEAACVHFGLRVLGWRDLPVASELLGAASKATEPRHSM